MLTDEEWSRVAPYLRNAVSEIKQYREEHGSPLAEAAKRGFGAQALSIYEEITGFAETNPNALFHHRVGLYGAPCNTCGKPLRTPQARHCAACGTSKM